MSTTSVNKKQKIETLRRAHQAHPGAPPPDRAPQLATATGCPALASRAPFPRRQPIVGLLRTAAVATASRFAAASCSRRAMASV